LDISLLPRNENEPKEEEDKTIPPSPSCSLPFLEMAPDSTSLLPGTVALIDLGHTIIVRRNIDPISFSLQTNNKNKNGLLLRGKNNATTSSVTEGKEEEEQEENEEEKEKEREENPSITCSLVSFAREIAARRNPVARVIRLDSPGTPEDRRVFAHLSPGHMSFLSSLGSVLGSDENKNNNDNDNNNNPLDALLAKLTPVSPLFSCFHNEDLIALLQGCPFTDQPFLNQFLRKNCGRTMLFQEENKEEKEMKNNKTSLVVPPPLGITSSSSLPLPLQQWSNNKPGEAEEVV
jgi:hypothetical protein